jgi:hypothetical protein
MAATDVLRQHAERAGKKLNGRNCMVGRMSDIRCRAILHALYVKGLWQWTQLPTVVAQRHAVASEATCCIVRPRARRQTRDEFTRFLTHVFVSAQQAGVNLRRKQLTEQSYGTHRHPRRRHLGTHRCPLPGKMGRQAARGHRRFTQRQVELDSVEYLGRRRPDDRATGHLRVGPDLQEARCHLPPGQGAVDPSRGRRRRGRTLT